MEAKVSRYYYYTAIPCHITWHKIVDDLKDKFYVVASDLRGYGESIGPEEGGDNHINYSSEQWQVIKYL